jgi:adenosylmethionine-8-amino-7-oxononanoate aminotransferase
MEEHVHLWRGMTNMAATKGNEVVIDHGSGAWVWDEQGTAYLDGTASLWYADIGHGRQEIADAVAAQMAKIAAFHTFDVYANRPALTLADTLAELAPFDDAAVFLTPGGGSDGIDTAAKLARRYWHQIGRPEKRVICARQHGYHGMNAYGTSLAGIDANREGYGELIPDIIRVGWDSIHDLAAVLESSADTIAAVIGEPVIGSGGIYPPPEGYWPEVERLCRAHDVLLIADEVITGFGRLGTWFGCQRYGFTPDMMVCAKGLTSGYVPLGAVIVGPRVSAPFWEDADAPILRHGYTYGGHPVACAAALANITVLQSEQLVERVAELEPIFDRIVRSTFEGCEILGEIRSAGLLAAVEVDGDVLADDPLVPSKIGVACRAEGLISRPLGKALQLSPAFITSEEELGMIATRLRAAFDQVAATLREPMLQPKA